MQPWGFVKKETLARVFPVNFVKFLRTRFLENTSGRLFLSGKPLYLFACERKTLKRIFNTNNELSHNRTEKQIMPFKTTVNWLFNDIWCYLVTGCFDWKIDVFQQTVVSVYYTLKMLIYQYRIPDSNLLGRFKIKVISAFHPVEVD